MRLILLFVIAYLVGSVNVPILLFRLLGRGDPRTRFSRNPGMTNVWRQAGVFWALVVLVLDMGKALAVSKMALSWLPLAWVPWVAFFLIIGNRFPCFHKFQGGKGVAHYLGFTALIGPLFAGIGMVAWAAIYTLTHLPFIGSFAMVFILSAGVVIHCGTGLIPATGVGATTLLIYLCHRQNVVDSLKTRRSTEKKPD